MLSVECEHTKRPEWFKERDYKSCSRRLLRLCEKISFDESARTTCVQRRWARNAWVATRARQTERLETTFCLAPILDTTECLPEEPTRQKTPPGVISAVQGMMDLLELPPGWNSYNARPIRKENVIFALGLLGQMMRGNTPAPNVIPMVRGGVQLEWHTRGINLEVSIYSPGEISFFAEDVRDGENPVEGEFDDLDSLKQWIERLSR